MLSTCMCVSIHISPSNFWASAWLWSLLAEGQRPWQHQAHENYQENEHLVWNKENKLTVPQQKKPPSSLLDSKGSHMSCKTKRNKAAMLWCFNMMLARAASIMLKHHSIAARDTTSCSLPLGTLVSQSSILPWAKGLNSPWSMQLPPSSYCSKEREKHQLSHPYHL